MYIRCSCARSDSSRGAEPLPPPAPPQPNSLTRNRVKGALCV